MNARRGYVPEDDRNFSTEAIQILRTASRHVCYLINEGYDLKSALTFVGNHFLLSERQRLAIVRSVETKKEIRECMAKKRSMADLKEQIIWIDGFNEIITLEVMLCQSLLFQGMDSAIRDLAALRGTYRLIPQTDQAIKMMFSIFADAEVKKVEILLDQPISNSGRLKMRMAEIGEKYDVPLDIQIRKDVDRTLYDKNFVITSDSIILNHCRSWFNLTEECLRETGADVLKVWE